MVKLAVFPKCYLEDICSGKMSLFDWIEMAVELRPEGLEFYSGFLESYDSGYLQELRERIRSHGLQMPMMCHSPDFTIREDSLREKEIEKQKEIIRLTAQLGGQFCRVLSGQRRPDISVSDGIDVVVKSIRACLPTARSLGVTLVIENHYKDPFWHYPEFAQKRNIFLRIVNRIRSANFGVQYDPSNCIMAGEDPILLLQAVKHRVRTMHASDRYLENGFSLDELRASDGTVGYPSKLHHGIIGKGLNDYDKIFSILKEEDFGGWISIEDGMNGMEEMDASMHFLRKMRKKHFLE